MDETPTPTAGEPERGFLAYAAPACAAYPIFAAGLEIWSTNYASDQRFGRIVNAIIGNAGLFVGLMVPAILVFAVCEWRKRNLRFHFLATVTIALPTIWVLSALALWWLAPDSIFEGDETGFTVVCFGILTIVRTVVDSVLPYLRAVFFYFR